MLAVKAINYSIFKITYFDFDEIDTVFLEKLLSKWERDYERDEVCRFCYYTFTSNCKQGRCTF
jgi:protein-arginine kinase activator protein McsA